MLKIRSDILYVRDLTTGQFVPLPAIRGADGIVENLSAFSTSEIGDSTYLLMTQKGASNILNGLMNGNYVVAHAGGADIANYATNAGRAETANHAETATEAATANKALYALRTDYVDNADEADSVSVMWSNMDETQFIAFTDDNGEISINENLTYNPKTKTLTVAKIAGKATEADKADVADKVDLPSSDEDENYYVVFGNDNGQLKKDNNARYNPNSNTLTVQKLRGTLTGNVTGNVTGTASFANALDFSTIRSTIISGGTGDLPSLEVGNMYLLLDRNYTGLYYHRGGGYDNAIVAFGPYYGLRINTSSGKPRIGITDIEADTMASYSTTLYFINLGKIAITEG